MAVSTSACMCVCTVQFIHSQCVSGFLCDFTVYMLMHIYDCMFVCLCVYIKQPLMAIGGGGGPAGVFALAAVQHSTFLCDIQYCDLRKPALQRSALSLCKALFLSLSCHLPISLSWFLSFPPFLSIIYSAFFHIWTWEIICQPPHSFHPWFIFPLSKSFSSTFPPYFFWQRSPGEAPFSALQDWAYIFLLSLRIHNTSFLVTQCITQMHISPLLGTPSASTAQPEARRSYSAASNSKTFIPATGIIIHIRIHQRKECILHVNFCKYSISYWLVSWLLLL